MNRISRTLPRVRELKQGITSARLDEAGRTLPRVRELKLHKTDTAADARKSHPSQGA